MFLAHDVWKALWFDGKFGIGVGTLVLLVNLILLGSYTFGCHSLRHLTGGMFDVLSRRPIRKKMLRLRELPESPPHAVRVDEPVLGRLLRSVRKDVLHGHLDGLENPLMAAEYQTFEHDVLVIGAGGAGLRAAIEASAAGVKVGVVSKSLLGKAHTVMAEGGMAAAMGNVDDRDNWRVHFADTMRGGQYLNYPPHGRAARQGSARRACANWKPGARCSIAPRTATFCSAISAAIAIRAWRTWATAPASR